MTPTKNRAQPDSGRRWRLQWRGDNDQSAGLMSVLGAAAFDRVAVEAGKRDA